MKNSIFIACILWAIIVSRNMRALHKQIELIQVEQTVLRAMFTTKVDYLNHLSWRHKYGETLREELERFEREAGVK